MSSNIFEFVRYFVILNKKINIFKKQHPDFHLGFDVNSIKTCDIESYNQKYPDNQINTKEHFLDSRMYFDIKNGTYSNYYKFLPSSIDASFAKVSPFVNL